MAYGTKYQSDFYNYFGKLVSVKIAKDQYTGSITSVRTSEVTIESNYEDDNTPVIGKGAKIVIIADSSDMTYLEDLLLSYEKEFQCTIEYDGTVVFRGWSLCDLNERQLLPFAAVTVQFTDYLHRAEGQYPEVLTPISGVINLYELIDSMVHTTGLHWNLYVNSTLFEDSMNHTVTDTWIPQTYMQNSVFYSDAYSMDNIYEAINKALQPFSAFMYSYKDKWIIERQEDMTRSGDWVMYGEQLTGTLPDTALAFKNAHEDFYYDGYGISVSPYLDGTDMTIRFIGFSDFGQVSILNTSGNLTGHREPAKCIAYVAGQTKIMRLFPNELIGTMRVICGGTSAVMQQTAEDAEETTCYNFCGAYADNWLYHGETLTYAHDVTYGWYIQFEGESDFDVAGVPLTGGLIAERTDTTQAYSAEIPKTEVLHLLGDNGTADITVGGQTKEAEVPTTSDLIASTVGSMKETYNKQNNDFEYVSCSQLIEYNSGLHTLILNLRDQLLDTLVFNDWPTPDSIPTTYYWLPASTTEVLPYRTWYCNENLTDITVGKDYQDISQWVHSTNNLRTQGWNYKFAVYANQDSAAADTILSIKYSMSTNVTLVGKYKVALDIFIRIIGGPYNDALMSFAGAVSYFDDPYGITEPFFINIFPTNSLYYGGGYVFDSCRTSQVVDISDGETLKWDFSQDINLDNCPVRVYNPSGTYTQYSSFWNLMGNPDYQFLIINFMPPRFTLHERYDPRFTRQAYNYMFADSYLGDIKVTVNAEEIANRITYILNKDFVRTEEIDLYLFDLMNMNYGNALLCSDGFTRTNTWTSENSVGPIPLYEILAKSKFRKYGRTIHKLKGTILHDGPMKPFSLLTDNNITNEAQSVINFLLNGYTWNLVTGQYDIEAEEYTEESVIVDGVEYDSEGNPTIPTLNPPTGLAVTMIQMYYHPLQVTWNPVGSGILGYHVEMRPWYDGTTAHDWVDEWKLIYTGTGTSVSLQVAPVGSAPASPTTIYFRARCYNEAGNSAWSSSVNISWYL